MKPQLKVLTGFSAGAVIVVGKPCIAIGRTPASDLRFDTDKELNVSARHAAILQESARWVVRDLGSRNGALVNGHKIGGDVRLDDTDQIQFGLQGPKVEFRLVADSVPDRAMPPVPPGQPGAAGPSVGTARGAPGPPRVTSARGSTTQRIKVEVKRQTKALRGLTRGSGHGRTDVSDRSPAGSGGQRRRRAAVLARHRG